jgi:hypothetical protein
VFCPECKGTVGRLRFVSEGVWLCADCAPTLTQHKTVNPQHFPFTTTNLRGDGKPVEVKSLRHLRQLESRHGVQSGAWN